MTLETTTPAATTTDTPAAATATPAPNPTTLAAAAAALAAPASTAADAKPADAAATTPGAPYWPEGLPEHLAGLKGKDERETIDKLTAELKGIQKAPAKPEEYNLTLSDDFKGRFGDLKGDPLVEAWRGIAHKHGISDAVFSGAIQDLYAHAVEKGIIEQVGPDYLREQLAKLGPKHLDRDARIAEGSKRVNNAIARVNALVSSGELTKVEGNIIEGMISSADGAIAIEKLLARGKEIGLQAGGGTTTADQTSEHERRMRAMFPSLTK